MYAPRLLIPFAAFLCLAGCEGRRTEPGSPASPETTPAPNAPDPRIPSSLDERFSYTYGYLLYRTLKSQGFDNLDASFFAQGAGDAERGRSIYTQEEMQQTLKTVQEQMLDKAKSEWERISEQNKQKADAFFKANAQNDGVFVLADGVQALALDEGDQTKPLIGLEDTVTLGYEVTSLDGVFITGTDTRGHGDVFTVSKLPDGFLKDGIRLLHPGAKYRFWVAYDTAHASGLLNSLEPNEAVVVNLDIEDVVYKSEQ